MEVELKILNHELYREFGVPKYATVDSAGVDLICPENITIKPGKCDKIHTGLALNMMNHGRYYNFAAIIAPRSGLGTRGLIMSNTIGVIDQDYQGEIIVAVWNRTLIDTIDIARGDRFAQMLFVPILKSTFNVVEEFSTKTIRGDGGYGSTGK